MFEAKTYDEKVNLAARGASMYLLLDVLRSSLLTLLSALTAVAVSTVRAVPFRLDWGSQVRSPLELKTQALR